ncbi:MAG: hypothetical protein K0Q46_1644 [Rhodococcus erythropolis]|nr:hypothetical protein [Rhodococcus erythropolis]
MADKQLLVGHFRLNLVGFRSAVETVAVHRLVHRRVGVSTAVVPRDICLRHRVVGRLVGADGSVHEELQQVCAQHVPVVVVILLAVLAAHYETADAAVSEERLVDGEVSEILLDRLAFVGVEWLARLDGIESRGGVSWVAGEGIWRQTGGQLITHSTTVRRSGGSAPLVTRTRSVGGMVRTFE